MIYITDFVLGKLAAVVPFTPPNMAFLFQAVLDSTYQRNTTGLDKQSQVEDGQPTITRVILVDQTALPRQYYAIGIQDPGDQDFFLGFNTFTDQAGGGVMYQPFYWKGPPQPSSSGQLQTAGDYQQAGTPQVLSEDAPQAVTVNLPDATWNSVTVQPLFCNYQPTILSSTATTRTIEITGAAVNGEPLTGEQLENMIKVQADLNAAVETIRVTRTDPNSVTYTVEKVTQVASANA